MGRGEPKDTTFNKVMIIPHVFYLMEEEAAVHGIDVFNTSIVLMYICIYTEMSGGKCVGVPRNAKDPAWDPL